ncbi:tripartite tricarboxylate transporter TctB family protein [Shumkonia mesophila]|uniref:tripartite tricarboxylate transporter TctB family protein n=1 Tax=Shumkonia mesophila TaxID=2838854 RepID=UPI0029352243|nr:tripartite tricarboxylate transporter TctB family protein [Shumkonia mesophila]
MRFNDAVFGIILMVFSAVVMIHAETTFPGLPGQDFGPAFFPVIIGGVLFSCGAVLTFQGIAKRRTIPLASLGEWVRSPRRVVNFVLVIGLLVFYVLVSDFLGFIPTSVLILALLTYRFGKGIVFALSSAVIVTLIMHTAFYNVLRVPLPWGILQPVAW